MLYLLICWWCRYHYHQLEQVFIILSVNTGQHTQADQHSTQYQTQVFIKSGVCSIFQITRGPFVGALNTDI